VERLRLIARCLRLGFGVTEVKRVLEPLGWGCSGFRAGVYVGFKKPGSPALYFNASAVVAPAHLAFKADREEQVMAFHRAALEAGGTDNGGPGPRPAYGAGYYAAFSLDADGHNGARCER
jgi:hypothetical protein